MTDRRYNRFSLLELVVVMLLLVTVAAMVAPRLTGFFGGRRLDDEARRLWALTRHARELAIDRALPIELAYDAATHRLTLGATPGYGFDLPSQAYDLGDDLILEAEPAAAEPAEPLAIAWLPDGSLQDSAVDSWVLYRQNRPGDAWRLTRQPALATFTLSRGAAP